MTNLEKYQRPPQGVPLSQVKREAKEAREKEILIQRVKLMLAKKGLTPKDLR